MIRGSKPLFSAKPSHMIFGDALLKGCLNNGWIELYTHQFGVCQIVFNLEAPVRL